MRMLSGRVSSKALPRTPRGALSLHMRRTTLYLGRKWRPLLSMSGMLHTSWNSSSMARVTPAAAAAATSIVVLSSLPLPLPLPLLLLAAAAAAWSVTTSPPMPPSPPPCPVSLKASMITAGMRFMMTKLVVMKKMMQKGTAAPLLQLLAGRPLRSLRVGSQKGGMTLSSCMTPFQFSPVVMRKSSMKVALKVLKLASALLAEK